MLELADKLIKTGHFLESIKLTSTTVDLTFKQSSNVEYFVLETIQNIIGDRQYTLHGKCDWVHLLICSKRKTKFVKQ